MAPGKNTGLDAAMLERLEKLAVNIPGVIYQYQQWPDGRTAFPYSSGGMLAIYGVRPEQVVEDASIVFDRIHPEDFDHVVASIDASAEALTPWACTYRVCDPGSGVRWLEGEATPEPQPDGSVLWHGYIRDVTVRIMEQRQREELERDRRLAAAVFENSTESIVICDAENRIVQVNEAFVRITGYSREEALGRDPGFLSSGQQDSDFYAAMWAALERDGAWRGEVWNRRKDGEPYAQLLAISVLCDEGGAVRNYLAVATDITPLKRYEDELEQRANYDPLTGVPNRRLLTDRVLQGLRRAQRSGKALALCYLDLDNFKPVNDRYGHSTGDAVLSEVARRLVREMRSDDTVARLGGDEFVLLFNDIDPARRELVSLLDRVLDAVRAPMLLQGVEHRLSASIGVALSPPDTAEPDRLIRHADQAMYRAKDQGRNGHVFYDAEEDRKQEAAQRWRARIAGAIEAGELFLVYQPVIDLVTGEPISLEALVRWQHPERGVLLPDAFIPDVEGTQLEVALGDKVIALALEQLDQWRAMGLEVPVSVNVSARQLLEGRFYDKLRAQFAAHPALVHADLGLEILESSALANVERARRVLEDCARGGFRVALDDFGTGYSSLSYFRFLPVDTVKIDRSFVCDMLRDPADMDIVRSVIGLAQAFDRRVIAEGVENNALATRLRELGCRYGQGYGISRPMPAASVPEWIERHAG
jgi:diguanylate cyclase (GGDEF)-like protein/PAS domain S-box-containing protein